MEKLRKNLVTASLMGLLVLGGAACNGDDAGGEEAPADVEVEATP